MKLAYSAVVLCAGSGTRSHLGYNKIFYEVDHKPLFLYALEGFIEDSDCRQIVVVVKESEKERIETIVDGIGKDSRIEYVIGGKERSESVAHAIEAVSENIVFVHDSARMKVEMEHLNALKDAITVSNAALLGLPIADTVKRVNADQVVGTEDRSTLYLAQTPQVFHTKALYRLLQRAEEEKYTVTDEIMLVEHYEDDAKIKMVIGSKKYTKWTYEEDFRR